jgi:hypothetical protein
MLGTGSSKLFGIAQHAVKASTGFLKAAKDRDDHIDGEIMRRAERGGFRGRAVLKVEMPLRRQTQFAPNRQVKEQGIRRGLGHLSDVEKRIEAGVRLAHLLGAEARVVLQRAEIRLRHIRILLQIPGRAEIWIRVVSLENTPATIVFEWINAVGADIRVAVQVISRVE